MTGAPEAVCVFAAAWLLDWWVGEPPAHVHPVVWMGNAIAPLKRTRQRTPAGELLLGALGTLFIAGGFAAATLVGLCLLAPWTLARMAFETYVLLSCFALRGLLEAGRAMDAALSTHDVPAARQGLMSLCSRDPSQLNETELSGATVESLTENTSDSVVAPLFYFALFGVAGAVFYRAVNTLDAMIGYRGRYEYLGKSAARLDDALNFIPARITVVLLWCAGALTGLSTRSGYHVWWRDRYRTESPNAGQVMAMAAGLLEVRLDKRESYVLGEGLALPNAAALARTLRLVRCTGWLWAGLLLLWLAAQGGVYGLVVR